MEPTPLAALTRSTSDDLEAIIHVLPAVEVSGVDGETAYSIPPSITCVSEDERGAIYSISLPGDKELMLLFSKAGTLRGGHSHTVPESVMVLTGKLKYHKLVKGEEKVVVLSDGQSSFNERGQVHMGEFLEDSIIVEWKRGTTKGGWKSDNYAPWRARVDAQLR